jgi:hypothetical protein
MPLAQVQVRYWAGAAVVVVAIAAIAVVLLTRGNSTTTSTNGFAPVRLSAAPATLTDATPCARSSVDLELTVTRGTRVTSADLVVLGRLASTLRACPDAAPAGSLVVRLPATASTVAVPALTRAGDGNISLAVLPPAVNVSCVWQITVSYVHDGKAGTVASQVFTAP